MISFLNRNGKVSTFFLNQPNQTVFPKNILITPNFPHWAPINFTKIFHWGDLHLIHCLWKDYVFYIFNEFVCSFWHDTTNRMRVTSCCFDELFNILDDFWCLSLWKWFEYLLDAYDCSVSFKNVKLTDLKTFVNDKLKYFGMVVNINGKSL